MKRAAVIVAGGSGKRLGGEIPKQYQVLDGKPIVIHTLEQFYRFDPQMELVVVVAPDQMDLWSETCAGFTSAMDIRVAPGGHTRFHSVKNGISLVGDGIVLAIHDAVRPLVSRETLDRCYSSAREKGSGIPVIDVDESVRKVEADGTSLAVDRSALKRVQTPQTFRSELIKEAYAQVDHHSFTDDATVFESHFGTVTLVEGNRQNIKITTPTDMQLASLFIRPAE